MVTNPRLKLGLSTPRCTYCGECPVRVRIFLTDEIDRSSVCRVCEAREPYVRLWFDGGGEPAFFGIYDGPQPCDHPLPCWATLYGDFHMLGDLDELLEETYDWMRRDHIQALMRRLLDQGVVFENVDMDRAGLGANPKS